MIRSLALGLLASTALLAACAGPAMQPSSIARLPATDHASAAARTANELQAECQGEAVPAALSESPVQRRNRLVGVSIAGADAAYNDYLRRLLEGPRHGNRSRADSMPELRDLGGAAVDLSRALSVTSGIVTGASGWAGRRHLRDQLLAIIVEQMDANRAVQRAVVLRRLRVPVAEWSPCLALADVVAYEQAGTFNAALAALSASAAEASRSARSALESELLGHAD